MTAALNRSAVLYLINISSEKFAVCRCLFWASVHKFDDDIIVAFFLKVKLNKVFQKIPLYCYWENLSWSWCWLCLISWECFQFGQSKKLFSL